MLSALTHLITRDPVPGVVLKDGLVQVGGVLWRPGGGFIPRSVAYKEGEEDDPCRPDIDGLSAVRPAIHFRGNVGQRAASTAHLPLPPLVLVDGAEAKVCNLEVARIVEQPA